MPQALSLCRFLYRRLAAFIVEQEQGLRFQKRQEADAPQALLTEYLTILLARLMEYYS